MEKNKIIIITVLSVLICAGMVGAYITLGHDADAPPKINSSVATEVVLSDLNASEYYSDYFKVPAWGVTTTELVESSPDGTTSDDGVWKVMLMQRSCACQDIKDLYVIEGYVSASTGELLEVSTKSVLESEYDSATCSSTSCH